MNKSTNYSSQAVDPDILSVLDVASAGKVVTAEVWKKLWNLVLTKINYIDEYCTTLDGMSNALDAAIEDIDTQLSTAMDAYYALKDGFVHYGTDAPTNSNTVFWVEPGADIDDNMLVTPGDLRRNYKSYVSVRQGNDVLLIWRRMQPGRYLLKAGSHIRWVNSAVEDFSKGDPSFALINPTTTELCTIYTDTEVLVTPYITNGGVSNAFVNDSREIHISAGISRETNTLNHLIPESIYTYSWEGTPYSYTQSGDPDKYSCTATLIKQSNAVTVDQSFDEDSSNPQSGTAVAQALRGKQNTLVSGQDIKTINGEDVLGSGDIGFKTINGESILGEGDIEITVSSDNSDTGESTTEIPELAPDLAAFAQRFTHGYIEPTNGQEQYNLNYTVSPFVPVKAYSKIKFTNINTPRSSVVHFYKTDDADGSGYMYAQTYPQNGVTIPAYVITVPPEANYIRFSVAPFWQDKTANGITEPAQIFTIEYVEYAASEMQAMTNIVKKWYTQTNGAIATLFEKAAKPMITFIDDDTVSVEHITRYKDLCDNAGIKGCYSVLTSELDENAALVENLLAYERAGFQCIVHCDTQGSEFNTFVNQTTGERTSEVIAACEANLVTGLQKMHKYGFTNYKYWCTPYGVSDPPLQTMAKKWGLNCLIASGSKDCNKPTPSYTRWNIQRVTLKYDVAASYTTTVADVKSAIDAAAENGGWVLVTTHSYEAGWSTEDGKSKFADLVTYATNTKGLEVKTIGEAFSIREPIYKFYETF